MTEVKKKSISGSLTKKNIEISHFEIFPDALLQHGIPLLIKKGTIKNVNIQMPTKFKSDPVTLTVESVTILCRVCTHDPIPEEIINMKFHKLKAYQLFRKRYKMILGLLHKESFFSVVRTIMSNLNMEIKHIHIQIEYSSKSKYDLTIPNFTFTDCDTKSSKPKGTQNSEDYTEYDEQDSSINLSENSSVDEESIDEESISDTIEKLSAQRFSSYQKLIIDSSPKKEEQEKVTSIGITIAKLSLLNLGNSKETTSKKFTKKVFFTNFGIYMDVDESPVDLSSTEKCEAELHNLFNSQKHDWIMKPFSFNAELKFEKDNPQLFFEPVIKQIMVNLKEEFIPIIINLLKSIDVFQKKFSVAHIQKPSFENPCNMWIFCHKCAVTKISNATYDFSKCLNLLEKRFVYLKNYKRKNIKSRNIIKNLEESLDYSTIVAFRSAYRLIRRKKRKSKKKSKITPKTTLKIIKEIRIDPVHFVTKILEMFSLHFSGDLLNVALTNKLDQKHIEIELKNPHFIVEKDLKSVLIHVDSSYLCVKQKENIIFTTLDNDQIRLKADVIIPFHSYSNWLVSLDMSNNNYTLNMETFLQIISDIEFIKLFLFEQNNNSKIQYFKKNNFQFNIQVFSSVIKVIGSKNNQAIQIAFDKFLLVTDPKTFEKKFKFDKSVLSFIADNEAKISTDFTFTGSLIGKTIQLDIPLFSCAIPFKYFVVIEDFIILFMKHQISFKDPSFPKIDLDFIINMKGMNVDITNLNLNQKSTIQIRQIMLSYENSVFNCSLLSIVIQNLFQLSNLTVFYDKSSTKLKISSISAKIIEMISLLPKDAIDILSNQISKSGDSIKNFKFPKLKMEFGIDNIDVDFSITKIEVVNVSVKNIKALINNDKLNASTLIDKIRFADQPILAEPISLQLKVYIGEITEIMMFMDKIDLNLSQMLIDYFFNLDFSGNKFELPKDIQLKFSLKLNQMTISNDLILKKFTTEFSLNNSMINAQVKVDSIDSSFLKLQSKSIVQMNMDIDLKMINLDVNLSEITISTIQFIELISKFPTITPSIPLIKLNLIIKPLQCNLCIGDDYLNVIFNSQIKFKLDNVSKEIPSIYLKITDFMINLNNNELLSMQNLKFTLDNSLTISIPSIIIKLTMFKIYKILKMIPFDHTIPIPTRNRPKIKILIYQIPYESMMIRIPLIEINIHKTNSKKCISLTFDNNELYLKNANEKSDLFASTKVHFDAFNGFLSYHLAEPFSIICNGEFSETTNKIIFESQNPIKFEISSYVINQILKNLTIKEDENEQAYSIRNETGTKIIIAIDNTSYKLETEESVQDVPNFVGSDIKITIGEISNSIKVYSSFSKIAYPLFFGNNFILLWMDVKRLQLRLLSPISFRNKSNVDLKIGFLNREISLKSKEVHYLDYTIYKLDLIKVKLDNDQQEIRLNETSVIKLANKFIIVTKKRKIKTLQVKIAFRTPYYFRNELISDLKILLKDQNQEILLKPCEVVPFPFFPPSTEVISFDIADSNDIQGLHVDLQLNEIKENRQIIPTIDKNGNPFLLQFSYISKKWNNIISISPLLIFYNSLSLPLIFSLSPDEKIDKEKYFDISKIFPYQNSENIWVINNPIMVSPSTNDIKKINIYISTKYSDQWSSSPFTMSDFDIIEDLLIPINDEILSLCHFHILTHCSVRPNTLIFFISPKYFINNQTDQTFSLNFIDGGESIEISPNSTIPVTIIRKTLKFSISIIETTDQKQKKKKNLVYSHKISIEKINSQYVKLHSIESPILLQLSTEKELNFINISLNQTLPYLFVNNTNVKVIFVQKNTPDFVHTVMPNEKLPFFIYDENMPTIIFCEISNKITFELDVNEPSFPVKIEMPENSDNQMNLYYYVDLSRKEGSIITLCNIIDDEIYVKNNFSPNSSINYRIFMGLANHSVETSMNSNPNKNPLLKNDALNLSFNFNFISFLIITSQYQEMCRLTLKDLMINSSIYDFSTKTHITVGLIKLDDQNQFAIYPCVFQILPIGNKPAIQFSFNSFGSHKYGKIEFDIRPINVRADLSFISDFIGDVFYIHNHYRKNNHEFKMNDVQITEIIHNLMPKQTKYHINKMSINPFKVHLSFHKISTRASHPFQRKFQFSRLINFIPSFEHIAITIEESHFFQNLSGTPDEIVFKISHEIKKLILKRLYRKISILGSRKMMKNGVEGVIQPEQKRGILKKAISILSIAESTFSYISSVMDLYTGSPPSIRTDETSIAALSWGFSSFISSFKNGAKQLVFETERRGRINGNNDYCGYVVGAGIGVSKCAAYCVSGFCNLNASLFSSVRRIFFSDKFEFIDERECEPSLGLHCSDNEKLLWYTGSVSSGLIEVYSQSIFILDDNLFIQNIVKVETKENTVCIYDENQNMFISSFDNEKQANHFYTIVESHLLRKKIIKLSNDITFGDES